jgi:hypothetical protein
MPHHQWRQRIARAAYPRNWGPDLQSFLKLLRHLHLSRAISGQVGVSFVNSEGEASKDMGCNWEGNEKWLKRKGLIDRSCEEQVLFRSWDGLGYKRNDRSVG